MCCVVIYLCNYGSNYVISCVLSPTDIFLSPELTLFRAQTGRYTVRMTNIICDTNVKTENSSLQTKYGKK